MKKKRIVIVGLIFLFFFIFVRADVCKETTLILGRVYFLNYENSQVVNATIEVWNNSPMLPHSRVISYSITNATGKYLINISRNMTSLNQTFFISAKWSDVDISINWRVEKPINISCGESKIINFEVGKCKLPIVIRGVIMNTDGSPAPFECAVVRVDFRPKGAGQFHVLKNSSVNCEGNATVHNLVFDGFSVDTTSWPTNVHIWAEPYQKHYYRYWDPNKRIFTKFVNISNVKCGDEIIANFYVFVRKNETEACSYNDECLSNICYNNTCRNQNFCLDNSWCNATSFCNISNNLCTLKFPINHSCRNNYECMSDYCNLTTGKCEYECQPANASINVSHYCDSHNKIYLKKTENATCSANYECKSNACNIYSHRCLPHINFCYIHNDCNITSHFCKNNMCQERVGLRETCSADYECLSNNCNIYSRRCLPNIINYCYENIDCNTTLQFCKNNMCQEKKKIGDECASDEECLTGHCYNGECVTCIIKGDVDGDASVNIFDAVKMLEYLSYRIDIKESCADMNEDKYINLFDVFELIQNV